MIVWRLEMASPLLDQEVDQEIVSNLCFNLRVVVDAPLKVASSGNIALWFVCSQF